MTTALTVWAIAAPLFLILMKVSSENLSRIKRNVELIHEKEMHHQWTVKKGIDPHLMIYSFPNQYEVIHNTRLSRVYVHDKEGMPIRQAQSTVGMTITEFEEILLGIEKL